MHVRWRHGQRSHENINLLVFPCWCRLRLRQRQWQRRSWRWRRPRPLQPQQQLQEIQLRICEMAPSQRSFAITRWNVTPDWCIIRFSAKTFVQIPSWLRLHINCSDGNAPILISPQRIYNVTYDWVIWFQQNTSSATLLSNRRRLRWRLMRSVSQETKLDLDWWSICLINHQIL